MKKERFLLIAPFVVVILGMIGYMLGEHYTWYEAVLASLKLLKVHLDPLPEGNVMLEVARWTGVLFFFSLIYTAVVALVNRGVVIYNAIRKDTVAIHGDNAYATLLAKAIGNKGLLSQDKNSYKAPKQVFLYEKDEDALMDYQKHADMFMDSQKIYLCLDKVRQVAINTDGKGNLRVVNMTEKKAIDYWQSECCKKSEKIVLIGSGEQAVQMLYWGLLVNVFDIHNRVTYYLVGDYSAYFNLHPEVKENMKEYGDDTIVDLTGDWTIHRNILVEADRIIMCDNASNNLEIAAQIMDSIPLVPLHIFVESEQMKKVLDPARCTFFGGFTESTIQEKIMQQGLERAAGIHDSCYAEITKDELDTEQKLNAYLREKEKTPEKIIAKLDDLEARWEGMSAHLRGSNIAQEIHSLAQKKRLMQNMLNRYCLQNGADSFWKEIAEKYSENPDPEKMSLYENASAFYHFSKLDQEWLAEIEHIRWCRYHFLNNWHVVDWEEVLCDEEGKPLRKNNGTLENKDVKRRLHKCLIPFGQLPEEEKPKDEVYYYTIPLRKAVFDKAGIQ